MYKVVGGVYENTTFKKLKSYEEYGPFDTQKEAYDEWKYRVWMNVDNALHRLEIKEI